MFWFEAKRADCSGDCGYLTPERLSEKLIFAGYPDNGYLQFQSALDFQGQPRSIVGIDPTYGLPDDPSTCAGSSTPLCIKVSTQAPTGCSSYCQCGGVNGYFVQSSWSATTYICQ